jgi:hypothetical protein
VTDLTATEWFDRLDPVNPPDFTATHPGWCLRHWAPAVRLDGNGRGAGIQLSGMFLMQLRRDSRGKLPRNATLTPAVIAEVKTRIGPECCYVGDDVMRRIWSRWIPVKAAR